MKNPLASLACLAALAMMNGCATPARYVIQDPGAPGLSREQVDQRAADAGTAEREFKHKVAAIDVGVLETKMEILAMKMPEYPLAARARSIEGTVVVEFIVGVDGSVEETVVVRPAHPLLVKAALGAVATWRFKPMRHQGAPVRVKVSQEVPFVLTK
jgi:TonB family protein